MLNFQSIIYILKLLHTGQTQNQNAEIEILSILNVNEN